MAVTAPCGRTHGDEDRGSIADALCQIPGKAEPPGFHVAGHQFVQARLVNWSLSGEQPRQSLRIFFNADHIMAEI